ncbi:MAG TPA: glutamate-5-semialdehyde dehydrogenase, partial [bacterium]|nr:glutamate-5-semialdehyde dehydrogenase [bacterium]
MQQLIQTLGQQARQAARQLARAETAVKNKALEAIAQALLDGAEEIIAANTRDLDAGKAVGLDAAMLDRLSIDAVRIAAMAEGVRQIIALPDPVGAISDMNYRPSGIQLGKMRVPIGVIGIIYESRPNVTVDAAVLCLKSGNAAILRGGSEAAHSNRALAACIQNGLRKAGLPETAVQLIPTTDREAVGAMLRARGLIDVIIPRGGKSLTERVANESLIPVIKHLDGICHVYIDDTADIQKALKVAINAKTHRYGVC